MHVAGVAVFAVVMSIMLAAMLPVMGIAPADGDGSDVAAQRMDLYNFTGQSMLTATPFVLKGVYTPYVPGQTVNEDENFTPDGWLYGESITYSEIGKVSQIRLDPNHKSNEILIADDDVVTYLKTYDNWWAHDYNTDTDTPGWIQTVQNIFAGIGHAINHDLLGMEDTYKAQTTENANYWTYSGYRYYFEPSVKMTVVDGQEEHTTTDQISLSIVWYQKLDTEGISGGLVIYNESTSSIVQNITMEEIIADYQTTSGYASNYEMNFNGTPITFSFRFDQKVLDGNVPLTTAFSSGQWTCAFWTNSVNALLDENSGMFSINAGNALKTYTQILTVSYPGLESPWDIIVWLLCTVPLTILTLEIVLKFLAIVTPSWI